jgi:hypothetical protein
MDELTRYGVPRSLAPFLQEYNIEDVDPERGRHTLIERTLRYGNRAEIRWLFWRYGERAIADWVQRWGALRLPRVDEVFWRVVLRIDGEG